MQERKGDEPRHKEAVISRLFGEFVGFLKANGLTDGEQFATQTVPIMQCSRKVIWIDQLSKTHSITVHLCSLSCLVEYGILTKDKKRIKPDVKIDNLRYKLSSGTEIELIDKHQELFDGLFEQFKQDFEKLKENKL